MIFRNDDVNPNSNLEDIKRMYAIIRKYYPEAEIYSCVTILGDSSTRDGSAYPHLSHKDIDFPYVDAMFDLSRLGELENIVSHGLWHLDHKHVSDDLQEHSIRSSCTILNTKTFIPPFWRWNDVTEKICKKHGIKLWVKEDWVNIDSKPITGDGTYLFHSWKHTPENFEEIFTK